MYYSKRKLLTSKLKIIHTYVNFIMCKISLRVYVHYDWPTDFHSVHLILFVFQTGRRGSLSPSLRSGDESLSMYKPRKRLSARFEVRSYLMFLKHKYYNCLKYNCKWQMQQGTFNLKKAATRFELVKPHMSAYFTFFS